jgi:hypothetical protein
MAPRWANQAAALLGEAAASVRVIAACTPQNLHDELARLAHAWDARGPVAPRFVHAPRADHAELRRVLEAMATALDARGDLGALHAARAREIADEACICEQAGTLSLWAAARRRYPPRDRFDGEADVTAAAWLAERLDPVDEESAAHARVRSDDETSAGSLVARMRQEIGARRLPLRVMVRENLASLAATGDGVVQVAAGRAVTRRDVERTVLHEIEGHVAPRARASGAALGLFVVGTARGSDDQEGRALAIERRAGFLDGPRRREIALRHVAARAVEARADFVSTVELLRGRGAAIEVALRIAARAHRGGGLARESVYLPALLRVEAAVAADGDIDRVLASGRVAVEAAGVLRGWLG